MAYERSDREGVNHGYWESDCLGLNQPWASLEAQLEKKLPAMQETWVQSLGWEKSPGEGNSNHTSILACRIPRTEKPVGLQSMGSQRIGHD